MFVDKLRMDIDKYRNPLDAFGDSGMDKDLGRLKILCRGLFYVLLLLTVVISLTLCLVTLGAALEIVDPGQLSGEVGMPSGETLAMLGFVIIVLAVAIVVLVMLMNIARSIYREYSPFTIKNVKRLEVIALAYLLLPVIIAPMMYAVLGGLGNLDVILLGVSSVLMAAIFYCLALVFRYGCLLQKESDETL